MIESIDDGVGMIVNKLESLDLLENTIIVFTSDNGVRHQMLHQIIRLEEAKANCMKEESEYL